MSIEKAYNGWVEQYDTNHNKTRDLDKLATIEVLSNYSFNKVIELGSGTGKNTEWLVTRAQQITCLDFSEGMMRKAAEKITSSQVIFKRTDLTQDWDIPDESADLATCSLVLEHIKDLDPIFAQVSKKLNQQGLFFVSELHPFKQYTGSKARFETSEGVQELEVYVHHISDYLAGATKNKFRLLELREWFDDKEQPGEIPRLITFVFAK